MILKFKFSESHVSLLHGVLYCISKQSICEERVYSAIKVHSKSDMDNMFSAKDHLFHIRAYLCHCEG